VFFKKMTRKIILILFLAATIFFKAHGLAVAVNINLVAVNPSSTETKSVPIKYYLPRELEPEDVISTAGLALDYDIDKGSYFVSGFLELQPKESKTIKIETKDVWRISLDEIDILKNELSKNLDALTGTQYYETAKILKEEMDRKLDIIMAQQQSYSDNVERRIEEYRAYLNDLNDIRKNAFSADFLKSPVGRIEADTAKTVKLVIEVQNPSEKDSKTVKHQHYLPKEVTSEDVVDRQGFDVRYDDEKQQSYLSKEEEFKPSETKKYEITIKDVWSIRDDRVTALQDRADRAFAGVKGTEFESSATYLLNNIIDRLQKIHESQKVTQDMKKHVGAFRTNKDRYFKAEQDLSKLEKMLALAQSKKLEELEKSKVKNVLQKLQALRGITAISQALFGKKPSITTTWKVIWGILAFVAFFTSVHFFVWWRKSQVMGEEMALKSGGVIKEITESKESPEPEK